MHLVADMALRLALHHYPYELSEAAVLIALILAADDIILTFPKKPNNFAHLLGRYGEETVEIDAFDKEYRDTIRKLFKAVDVNAEHIWHSREVQFKNFRTCDTNEYHT